MSWLFSQALVAEYLGENSLDGEQSVQLNGNNTQLVFLQPDKMTDFSRLSRFGMMFKPLTENLGEELLTLYLADFHAKTLVQQAEELESQEQEVQCGDTWHGLLGKYDHNLHLWRTVQCSLLEDLEQSLEIFPRWGMTRNGVCWERQTLEQTTNVKESGLLPDGVKFFHTPTTGRDGGSNSRKALKKRKEAIWPTPTTPTGGGNAGGSGAHKNAIKNGTYIPSSINPNLYEWLMGWPLEWTDLKPLEMDKFHKWLELHG